MVDRGVLIMDNRGIRICGGGNQREKGLCNEYDQGGGQGGVVWNYRSHDGPDTCSCR